MDYFCQGLGVITMAARIVGYHPSPDHNASTRINFHEAAVFSSSYREGMH